MTFDLPLPFGPTTEENDCNVQIIYVKQNSSDKTTSADSLCEKAQLVEDRHNF